MDMRKLLNCQKAKEILYTWTGYMVEIVFLSSKRKQEKNKKTYMMYSLSQQGNNKNEATLWIFISTSSIIDM
jgi:hypothetical protein